MIGTKDSGPGPFLAIMLLVFLAACECFVDSQEPEHCDNCGTSSRNYDSSTATGYRSACGQYCSKECRAVDAATKQED